MNNTAIVVIGAGIAGLSAAATLKSAGKEVIVLEASNRPGGRIVRMSRNGDFVEAGAQGIHTNYREMRKLADAYGLSPDLVVQRNRQAAYLDRQGSLRYPKGSYGITKLMDHRGTLDFFRFIARYMAMGKRFSLFETHRDIPSYDKVSAAEAFAWAGRDFKDFVLRPASHAMANTTPEHTNLYHLLNLMKLMSTSRVVTLRTGNVTLTERMAEHVGVRYEAPASKILMSKGMVDGIMLENGEVIKAGHVIVACPVGEAAKLLPDDMLYAKEFLTTFPNAPFGLVYFFLDRPLKTEAYIYMGHAYRDAVFNMAINHTVKTPHMVPSGKAIISAWPCYPDSAALATQSDEAIIAAALEDMRAFFPDLSGWVEEARVQRHAWGVGRLSPGQHAKILKFKREVESVRSISFAGNDYDGVHMESGVRGGLRAAERVLKGIA